METTAPCFQRQKCQWPKAELGTQCAKYGCPTPWRKASKWQECCHPGTSVTTFEGGQSLAQPMLVFNSLCRRGWPGTPGPFLLLPPNCWDFSNAPPCQRYAMLEIKARSLSMLGKHSALAVMPPLHLFKALFLNPKPSCLAYGKISPTAKWHRSSFCLCVTFIG